MFGLHAGHAGRVPAQPRAGLCLSAAAQASEARRGSAFRGASRLAKVPPARQSLVRVHEQLVSLVTEQLDMTRCSLLLLMMILIDITAKNSSPGALAITRRT